MHSVLDDPEEVEFQRLFFPSVLERLAAIHSRNGKFVHYTSAEGAMGIIQSKSIWMRNAVTMNDYSEIEHGLKCLSFALNDELVGGRLKKILNDVHAGAWDALAAAYDRWLPDMRANTYLTSVSEHLASEDDNGRLSMWRAYGATRGVALVLNLTPFAASSDALGANSHPVEYADEAQFTKSFSRVVDNVEQSMELIASRPPEWIVDCLLMVFRYATLCTKHPGFAEEREWRVIYSPMIMKSPIISQSIRSLSGVPQIIQSIPLVNSPSEGLVGADPNGLIDRLIIGPSQDRFALWQAFVSLLDDAGVERSFQRVHASGIPLRT
jgi:hypothetical protein